MSWLVDWSKPAQGRLFLSGSGKQLITGQCHKLHYLGRDNVSRSCGRRPPQFNPAGNVTVSSSKLKALAPCAFQLHWSLLKAFQLTAQSGDLGIGTREFSPLFFPVRARPSQFTSVPTKFQLTDNVMGQHP